MFVHGTNTAQQNADYDSAHPAGLANSFRTRYVKPVGSDLEYNMGIGKRRDQGGAWQADVHKPAPNTKGRNGAPRFAPKNPLAAPGRLTRRRRNKTPLAGKRAIGRG